MSGKREILDNCILIFLSIVVVFAALESALYVAGIQTKRIDYQWCNGPNSRGVVSNPESFHPIYGHTEVPNHQYLERIGNDEWELHTYNENGFRDTYSSGDRHIIVLGDSFTRGTLVSDNETYEFLLDRWAPKTAFHNFGAVGYGTDQEFTVYRNVRDRWNHSLVIIGYYVNDPRNNVDTSPRAPHFSLKNGTLIQDNYPKDEQPGIFTILNHPIVNRGQSFLSKNTRTYPFLRPKVRTTAVTLGLINASQRIAPPKGKERRYHLALTKALLLAINGEAGSNTDVLILFFPSRGEINPNNPHLYPSEVGQPYWDAQRAMLQSVVENNSGMYMIDTTSYLRNASKNGRQVYGDVDAHFDDDGHHLIARITYDWLADNNYIQREQSINFTRNYSQDLMSCPE